MTLWLTRIVPDLASRRVRHDLGDIVRMHRRVLSMFPDGLNGEARRKLGVLFRVENTVSQTVLVQSAVRPDLSGLPYWYGDSATRPLAPLVDALAPGRAVHYRIAGNAIRRLGPGSPFRAKFGDVMPLGGAEAEQWWARKAAEVGLDLRSVLTTPLDAALGTKWRRSGGEEKAEQSGRREKKDRPVRHSRTLFEGHAVIADAGALRTGLRDGVGRGKAYGCGLLTLAPARGAA
ncbi:type I-E CRISPR-associated protein Cas6/Cse3/CasE [Actinoalloteichus caeruleus]|uniref:type I-E CRISPR-associated protein Cas6/Cse3/CasE n=1 Tax=Actinoalloteichus cyanogriseus TaxID=2893586 RepID=UPI003BB910BC